jgi:hypothetical protein
MSGSDKSGAVLRALKALSKASGLSINALRVVLALERMVARLTASKVLSGNLIFKGGFVLFKEFSSPRFTRDLDALAQKISKEKIEAFLIEALALELDDGLYYANPIVEELVDQGPYGGLRISVPFQIGLLPSQQQKINKLSRVHIDVGFGDVFQGEAREVQLKPLLEGQQSVSWSVYPTESIFAEKLETLVSRGSANSRGRDLYDLVLLFKRLGCSPVLQSAIVNTFSHRLTRIPPSFSDFLATLDLTVLRNSWKSVELKTGKITFEECLTELRAIFVQVDTLLGGKL